MIWITDQISRNNVLRLVDFVFLQDSSQITISSTIVSFDLSIGVWFSEDLIVTGRHSSTFILEKCSLMSLFDREIRRWTVLVVWLKLSIDRRKIEFLRGLTGSKSSADSWKVVFWMSSFSPMLDISDLRNNAFRCKYESDLQARKSSTFVKFFRLNISEQRRLSDFLRRKTSGDFTKGSLTILKFLIFRYCESFWFDIVSNVFGSFIGRKYRHPGHRWEDTAGYMCFDSNEPRAADMRRLKAISKRNRFLLIFSIKIQIQTLLRKLTEKYHAEYNQ